MAFKNLKKDFKSFNLTMGSPSGQESFKISEVENFKVVWHPLDTPGVKMEKVEFLKRKEQYQSHINHLVHKYNVRHPKEGKRRLRLQIDKSI